MFKNYLITAWRNLVKNKTFSVINIAGFAIGLAACMLIVLYVGHEKSFDLFHKNADRMFWMQTIIRDAGDSIFISRLRYSSAPTVANREPSVESFLRTRLGMENPIIQNPEKPVVKFAEPLFLFADSNFFSFFSFNLLQGSKEKVLHEPLTVVISQQAAKKYFGTLDVVGKTVRYNNEYNFTITGLAEDAPSNSTIIYDFVASLSSLASMKDTRKLISEERNDFTTYITLKPTGNITRVENALALLAKENESGPFTSGYRGVPVKDLRSETEAGSGSPKYTRMFLFVAGLVLLLALINYMSLSTARSSIRAKEIGLRKVMGAGRAVIATQFFMESFLYVSISFVLGYLLCIMLQPLFFGFLQIDIDHSFLYSPVILVSFAMLFAVTVIMSSIYPSIILSAFKPVSVLYGRLTQSGNVCARKIFTVFQFTIAVVFIISGIIIQKQIKYFKTADTGMNRENVLMVPFDKNLADHAGTFSQNVNAIAGVQQTSMTLQPMFKAYSMTGVIPPLTNKMIMMPIMDVDRQFISMLGLKWKDAPTDSLFFRSKNAVILNETAVEQLQLGQDPIGKQIGGFTVAGVLKDFNWQSLEYRIKPLLVSVGTGVKSDTLMWAKNGGCLYARISSGVNMNAIINQVKRLYQQYEKEYPFEYYFMDDAFDAMYKSEERLANILSGFTLLAIVIACLGLFGLVTFMTLQRIKEIGIRKTLGASVYQIVHMLSFDFVKLVIVSVIIACPVAWYCMHQWLQGFAYRTNIEWWVFAAGAIAAIVIAWATVGLKSMKAATVNPVKSLRTE
jgi:putative ABC transport system permease protein